MSNIYIQEPPTHGKVLLETTVGDVEIELWSRECPKACKNFVQLCMESYYNKTPFHRVVRDFIVQGGDPTGSGTGGQSIYGHPFKDEFHTRLRFVRRGLVAMANSGVKDDNGSQFFFTFGPTQELQNKHTIFGKVVGDTIYNMLKLQEGGLVDERPENPHKILRTKVLTNPFPDIQPRKLIEMIKEDKKPKRPKSNMRATKDFSLLSFGEEAEEEEEDLKEANKAFASHGKSSHDLLKDPKLSSKVGIEVQGDKEEEESPQDSDVEEQPQAAKKEVVDITSIQQKLKKEKNQPKAAKSKVVSKVGSDEDNDDEDEDLKAKLKKREEILKEIKALKRDIKGDRGGGGVKKDEDDAVSAAKKPKEDLTEEEKGNDLLVSFHKEREVYASKKTVPKKGSAREAMTMQLLEKFKSKLHAVKDEGSVPVSSSKASGDPVDEEEVDGDDWMASELRFDKSDPVIAKDANSKDDEWFDIFDPRNPVNKRRRGEKEKDKKH